MAFWGIELKPKEPFKLSFDDDLPLCRLHLSQATLGLEATGKRTLVKCNVDGFSDILICSLVPGVVESCSLDLFFDEGAVFSVVGSSSVHLCGYYEASAESYSDSEEEDSLVDDYVFNSDQNDEDEIQTQAFNSGVRIEEVIEEPSAVPFDERKDEKTVVNPKANRSTLAKRKKHEDSVKTLDDNGNGMHDDSKAPKQNEAGSLKDGESEDDDGFTVVPKRRSEANSNGELLNTSPAIENTSHEGDTLTSMAMKKAKKKHKRLKEDRAAVTPRQSQDDFQKKTDDVDNPIQLGHEDKSLKENGATTTAIQKENFTKKPVHELPSPMRKVVDLKLPGKKTTVRKYPNGLEVENIEMGIPDGKQAKVGKRVEMLYTGRLKSTGQIFDTNIGKKPLVFRLGVGEVIKGWDVGVNGMRLGDKRRITVPPAMGYGPKGVPGIPPNSWLVFDVELVNVK